MPNETRIELHKSKDNQFFWKKVAGNGEDISRSTEMYSSKQAALEGLRVDTLITLHALEFTDSIQLDWEIQYYDMSSVLTHLPRKIHLVYE